MTTKQAMLETGATPRQLQWLDENGIVPVQIDGHSRVYTSQDVQLVKVWLRARACDLGYVAARRAVESARRRLAVAPRTPFMICAPEGDPVFLSTPQEILKVFSWSTRPAVLVAL